MSMLTINKDGTPSYNEVNYVLHELEDSRIKRHILSGIITDMEVSDIGAKNTNCRVRYKNQSVLIPISEMGIELSNNDNGDEWVRKTQILSKMLGAVVDFIVRGIDRDDPDDIHIVASRADALRKKRFEYFTSNEPIFDIEKYDKAEARVIAVSQQSARLEICGVELTLPMNELFWSWVADVREHLSPGDVIPVKILDESVDEEGNIKLRVSGKEAVKNTAALALKKIHAGNKCVGVVTHIEENQPVFIRLENGANAIAHNSRVNTVAYPGDIVTLAINVINEEKQTAVGVITNVIKQNKEF